MQTSMNLGSKVQSYMVFKWNAGVRFDSFCSANPGPTTGAPWIFILPQLKILKTNGPPQKILPNKKLTGPRWVPEEVVKAGTVTLKPAPAQQIKVGTVTLTAKEGAGGYSGAEAPRGPTDQAEEVDALGLKPERQPQISYPPGVEPPASDSGESSIH